MLSGRDLSLLPDTLRIFRLNSSPIESGNDVRKLEESWSSSKHSSPAMESGIAWDRI